MTILIVSLYGVFSYFAGFYVGKNFSSEENKQLSKQFYECNKYAVKLEKQLKRKKK